MSLLSKPHYPRSVAVGRPSRGEGRGQLAEGLAVAAAVAAPTLFLGFNAGGFFAGQTAAVAVAFCLLAALGALVVRKPLRNATMALLVPLGLLTCFALWTLASATWEGGSARALIEFDLALLYVVVLASFGLLARARRRLEWGLRGFAAAAVAICVAGWVTRVAADVWPIALDVRPERLSFPLTYWNALGLLATLGAIACVHLSSSRREPRPARVAAAAATPLLCSTLLLTYSRASLALLPIGLLVYAAVARPRRMVSTLLAVAAPVAVAMVASYDADQVSSAAFSSPAGLSQGHALAVLVVICAIVAGGLRAMLMQAFDRRLEAWLPPPVDRRRAIGAAVAAGVALVAVLVALGAPGWVADRYNGFVEGDVVGHHNDPRARLTSSGNNGRVPQWEVAIDAFSADPLKGQGAGTYQLEWARNRPYRFTVIDAHSLYVEVLGELGVVGFLLIVGALVAIGVGLARRAAHGEARGASAAALTLGAVWAVHAGVDWDWEMPAVTLWLFALAGLALSESVDPWREPLGAGRSPRRGLRVLAALGLVLLGATPAAIAVSQSRLDHAVASFEKEDCGAAIDSAQGSIDVLSVRPDPYEVIGYCDVRLGDPRLAEEAMEKAVDRDPDNWETHYGLALVRAAAGADPTAELEEALRLNPREAIVGETLRRMRGKSPERWEELAREASLPF
jgi:O-antigen ligase